MSSTSETGLLSEIDWQRGEERAYKGFAIRKGRLFQDYGVNLDGSYRWGTLDEVLQYVEDFLAGTLPPPKRKRNYF